MASFNYEANLAHQQEAVNSALLVFKNSIIKNNNKGEANPVIQIDDKTLLNNLTEIFKTNKIKARPNIKDGRNFIDISMETGTGKTYTYTKLMFELNKNYAQTKFIIITPTLSIKAGTINFLDSKATREHFRHLYQKEINLYILESKNDKKQNNNIPLAISDFVTKQITNDKEIEILIINAGMINSKTMQTEYDKALFDEFNIPFEALKSTNAILIIDEPHKFKDNNKTIKNIQQIEPKWIFRFGATFDNEEKNLVYKLTSAQAFNDNLVKGVRVFINDFNQKTQEQTALKLIELNNKEATFELNTNDNKSIHKIAQKDNMGKIHKDLDGLYIENIKSTKIILSNGIELKKNDKINPFSYNKTLNETMINEAINEHFKLEEELFLRDDIIKPLTLFFIDDIKEYRDENGRLKLYFESILKTKLTQILNEQESKTDKNQRYINYLKKSIQNISLTHGGYFSKDNQSKDENIENEINEILHDKESLLNVDNPRRFIFSKWTLKEGWDNPNVFGICKLRSSGSTTSKLQEVGRGLRLPVNEYGSRIKNMQFYLNYFVDFTERDFATTLINEINQKSSDNIDETSLNDEMINKITTKYNIDKNELLINLDKLGVINRDNTFLENGLEILKKEYSLAFNHNSVQHNKITTSKHKKPTASIRLGKYQELKELWEKINQKATLRYKIKNEKEFLELFRCFLKANISMLKIQSVTTSIYDIKIENQTANYLKTQNQTDTIIPLSYMKYGEFLLNLAKELKIKIDTIHQAFIEISQEINDFDINNFLSKQSIKFIKNGFTKYILDNSFSKFGIEYKNIKNDTFIKKTAFTDKNGNVLKEIEATNLGLEVDNTNKSANSYLFDEIFFDSELERENILSNIDSIVVFTKIPKNSIKIPISGGGSYSPDFAYVIKDKKQNQSLYLIVETKNKDERDLTTDEQQKIAHAREFLKTIGTNIKIKFEKQLRHEQIKDIINRAINA